MKQWERFPTFKQRGEWVELQFMAAAAERQFAVSKPWGDTRAYDVGIEHGQNFLRVQVKSTARRCGAGFLCQFKPNHLKRCDYSLSEIDLFAAYVIPENAWYLIPAVLLLGEHRKTMAMLSPVVTPAKKASYRFECYREAWSLLKKSRNELREWEKKRHPPKSSKQRGEMIENRAADSAGNTRCKGEPRRSKSHG